MRLALFAILFSTFLMPIAESKQSLTKRDYDLPEAETIGPQAYEPPPPEELDLLNASSQQLGQFQSTDLYLRPEVRGLVSVTDLDHPHAAHEDCKINPSWCVAWPDEKSKISRLPFQNPIKRQTGIDPRTGEPLYETFLHVRVQYEREFDSYDCGGRPTPCKKILKQDKEGWINARYLSDRPMKSLLEPDIPSIPPKAEPCVKSETAPSLKKLDRDSKEILKKTGADYAQSLEQKVDAIKNYVGNCPLKNPSDKSAYQEKWRRKNIYDEEVLPQLKMIKHNVPPVLNQKGQRMSWDDLVDIDALARTVYSEMNECFKDGIEYPMAAARVALNRVDDVKKGINKPVFLKSWFHSDEKPDLAKILTADRQFSVWNYLSGPKDKTILMSLCPSKNSGDKQNWKGQPPSKQELSIWNQALQIATEAVLHPKTFIEKTKDIQQRYYTSKMSAYAGRTKPHPPPQIMGRTVESFKCMYLWNGK